MTDVDSKKFGMSDSELQTNPLVYSREAIEGKRILITGGGTGIGKATAWLFGRLGARLIIAGRTQEKLDAAANIMREHGIDVSTKQLNIKDPELIDAVFTELFEEYGGLDVLINNAGGQFPCPALDISPNGWKAVVDNNLNGTWFMMQAAARRWRDQGTPGNIINMVAVIDKGMTDIAHTCAARAGVIYTSKTVAVEWAQYGIRVNCVAPGIISSEGMEVYPPEAVAKFPMSNPMKRFGTAWDVAQACGYLASDASNFMTGEVMTLDGGGRYWGELWTFDKPDYFKGP